MSHPGATATDRHKVVIIGSLFGWKKKVGRKPGPRRFRHAYIEVARKNGKSTIAGGVGDYMLVADEEGEAAEFHVSVEPDCLRLRPSRVGCRS